MKIRALSLVIQRCEDGNVLGSYLIRDSDTGNTLELDLPKTKSFSLCIEKFLKFIKKVEDKEFTNTDFLLLKK